MGKQMSLNGAAKYNGVNKKSLLQRVSGEIPLNAHVGKNTVLSPPQENELAESIKLMADWGYGFTSEEVKDIVQQFVQAWGLETPFKDCRPGYDWMEGFKKRHPDIVPRKTEHLSKCREQTEDPEVVERWFKLLDEVLTEQGVKDIPAQIFNSDESGFVTDPKSGVVLARKGSKRVNQSIGGGGSGKDQITVNCCASATGKLPPPYVVYNSKNLYKDWITDGPKDTAYVSSTNGWMEGALYLDWFETIFLKHTEDVKDKPRVLIFDGHASHLSLALIKKARDNNVVLLRLPAHLTHILQPLDRAVFRPVKIKWQSMLLKFARTHNGPVGKRQFPKMLKQPVEESFRPHTVLAGFSSTGIYPFNDQAVEIEARPQSPQPSVPTPSQTSPLPVLSPTPGPASTAPSPTPGPASTAPSPGSSSSETPTVLSSPAPSSSHFSPPASPGAATSSSNLSVKDFFLKQLTPQVQSSA
ncbi:uncharacterized protein LOC135470678 [Liolophura sinensis]|uniref:uncharacterized protein LOC135470678 n=1 Tax=Liolophura sinensis TaxID=3198878 RepID=UPI003158EB82